MLFNNVATDVVAASAHQQEATDSSAGEDQVESHMVSNMKRKLIIVSHLLPWIITQFEKWPAVAGSRPSSNSGISSSEDFETDAFPDSSDWSTIRITRRKGNTSYYAGIIHSSDTTQYDDYMYVGCLGISLPDAKQGKCQKWLKEKFLREKKSFLVFPTSNQISGHDNYCKNYLRPIFHYIIWDHTNADCDQGNESWKSYMELNQTYCDAIMEIYNPGDHIWIHDYQLMLLPNLIQKNFPQATIGFYLHSSFPSSEIFRCLPQRKQILEGVLSSTLIAFQNYSYARHFMSSCTRVLGLESKPTGIEYKGYSVSIGIFPTGVQVDKILSKKNSASVLSKIPSILKMFEGKKIIIGRDKMSQLKGVLHKLNAFEKLLIDFPQWCGQVILVQITTPEASEDRKTELKVWETISRINGRFGSLQFLPVHYFSQHFEQDHYLALLSAADVGLVTSERDAISTTAYEFVLCQQDKKSPLIISEFTGNASLFNAAIIINPWDYKGVAASINDALNMSDMDRHLRYQQLFGKISQSSMESWAKGFLEELAVVTRVSHKSSPTPFLNASIMIECYKKSNLRLILLDYDGTLTPIRRTPSAATPSPKLIETLQQLTKNPQNVVFIISGRDQIMLDQWLGNIEGLGLSAEHGCFIKFPRSKWVNMTSEIDLGWKNTVLPIFEYYTERTPGSFIEHKKASLTWHYRLADPDFGSRQANDCQSNMESSILSKLPVEILVGKKNLEVRPISVNKGEVVKRLLSLHPQYDFIFCAGDDRTDEDMFRQIDRAHEAHFTCMIGTSTKVTNAKYYLSSTEDVILTLSKLAHVI